MTLDIIAPCENDEGGGGGGEGRESRRMILDIVGSCYENQGQ